VTWEALASTLSVALLALVVGVGLGLAFALRRSRALREIRAAMAQMADGKSPRRIRPRRADAHASLAAAFNRMLERVERTQAELRETNRNLEAIVGARTLDLRRSERKYRSLVGQATVGILLWDPDTLAILEANAKAGELLGERPRDLLRTGADALFTAGDREQALRALRRTSEVGAVRLPEVELWHARCGAFPAEVSASMVRFGEEAVVLGLIRDLSETKEFERRTALLNEQIQRTEKEVSIGQLAAGVAHEINNPMGYVASNINRLVEYSNRLVEIVSEATYSTAMSPLMRELHELVGELESIAQESREGVSRVIEIVRALREFSHGGAGDLTTQCADLNDVVKNCLALVQNDVKERVDLDLAPLPSVLCHPMQIAQVVMNLIVNAAHAVEPPGRIRVSSYDSGDLVHIAVDDDGPGIPELQLAQIFDPFFTTKPVGHGTGLGLAVSHEIVRRHQGHLWVDSQEGRGSRFLLELPLEASLDAEPPSRSSANSCPEDV
jgi:PAS domain S-box-containing protein